MVVKLYGAYMRGGRKRTDDGWGFKVGCGVENGVKWLHIYLSHAAAAESVCGLQNDSEM